MYCIDVFDECKIMKIDVLYFLLEQASLNIIYVGWWDVPYAFYEEKENGGCQVWEGKLKLALYNLVRNCVIKVECQDTKRTKVN